MENTDKNTIFVVDDDQSITKLLTYWLENDGHNVQAFHSGETFVEALSQGPDAVCMDIRMNGMDGMEAMRLALQSRPGLPVIMATAQDSLEAAVEAMQKGAYDFITKPIDRNRLLASIHKALEKNSMEREIHHLRRQLGNAYSFASIVGKSRPMARVFEAINKVLDSDIAVFVQGESGTGKELIARALHFEGARAQGPFEAVNCGAIPDKLQESELFGHEKGAFTDAHTSQTGKVEMAHGGTLFLDEVGEMSSSMQIKLLRFLQDKTIERVGGRRKITVDVRIISATNKDLQEEVRAGRFREDLYYRLVVYPIVAPPLRERKDDIPSLVHHFIGKYQLETKKNVRSVDSLALDALAQYVWPGNVRELENVIYRAMVAMDGEKLTLDDLPSDLIREISLGTAQLAPSVSDAPPPLDPSQILSLAEMEKRAILHAIEATEGNCTLASQKLGIGRATFYRKLDRYDLYGKSPYLHKRKNGNGKSA